MLVRAGGSRPLLMGTAVIALALAYSTLHIIGMGLLRELGYGLAGWNYTFPWSQQFVYELRKDLFGFLALAAICGIGTGGMVLARHDEKGGVKVTQLSRQDIVEKLDGKDAKVTVEEVAIE